MGFCGKVDDHVRFLFFKKLIDSFSVTNIGFYEAKIRLIQTGCSVDKLPAEAHEPGK